jgi:stage II sporulation protein D
MLMRSDLTMNVVCDSLKPLRFLIAGLLFLILLLFDPFPSDAFNVRILILDESHKSIPELDDIYRVGNMDGKLLYKGTEYSGKIEVYKGSKGLFVVNELPIEEYVKGVVKAEVGENWPIEALKAQAVAVRTYAIYNIKHKKNDVYDLTSSTLSQLYKGLESDPSVEAATDATRGEILTYNGKPINAMYHSTSGGVTELPEEAFGMSYPYLKSVTADCESSPYYMWERRIPRKDLQDILSINVINNIKVSSVTKTGRAKEITISYEGHETVMKAQELRKLLGWKRLPSTWFTITASDEYFIFNGKGYGHGVGMDQWSSMEMANKGVNYKEILSTFYPGTTIELYED